MRPPIVLSVSEADSFFKPPLTLKPYEHAFHEVCIYNYI